MHRLSIVIPCPVFDEHVEETLVSVLENRPRDCRILVVTAGEYEDPYQLSGEVDFVEEHPDATLVQLVNRGFREASSDIVHVLAPGSRAVDGWTDHVLQHFGTERVAMVSPVVLRQLTDPRALWIGLGYLPCGVRRVVGRGLRLAGRKVAAARVAGPSLVAGFYRRDAVEALGGFDERMEPACADLEMALALRDLGMSAVVEPQCRVLSVASAVQSRTTFQSARHLERLYRRFKRPGVLTTLLHLMVVVGDVVSRAPHPRFLVRFCGRLAAWLETGVRERQELRLQQALAHLSQGKESSRSVAIRLDFSQRREKSPQAAPPARRRRAA